MPGPSRELGVSLCGLDRPCHLPSQSQVRLFASLAGEPFALAPQKWVATGEKPT